MNIRVNLIKEEKNMLLSHKTDIQLNTTESNIVVLSMNIFYQGLLSALYVEAVCMAM